MGKIVQGGFGVSIPGDLKTQLDTLHQGFGVDRLFQPPEFHNIGNLGMWLGLGNQREIEANLQVSGKPKFCLLIPVCVCSLLLPKLEFLPEILDFTDPQNHF